MQCCVINFISSDAVRYLKIVNSSYSVNFLLIAGISQSSDPGLYKNYGKLFFPNVFVRQGTFAPRMPSSGGMIFKMRQA